jgi:5-methylcytosine-specific restriction protein A
VDALFACVACRAPVWPFNGGGHTAAHFEHNRRNPDCPLGHRTSATNATTQAAAVERLLASFSYERDDREPADPRRRGQFQAGWNADRQYTDKTLRVLTWRNLGFRFGRELGALPLDEVIRIYEIAASFQNESRGGGQSLPEEVPNDSTLLEGSVTQISINAYERNPVARRRCLKIYGDSCYICKLNFGQSYGLIAEGYIHVHHLRPLSEIGERYKVDPKNDLRPVCPNCHAVLHLRHPPFSVDELAEIIDAKKNRE